MGEDIGTAADSYLRGYMDGLVARASYDDLRERLLCCALSAEEVGTILSVVRVWDESRANQARG